MAEERFLDVLLRRVCDRDRLLSGILALILITFVLMLVSLTAVRPGSGTYVIVVVNLVGLVLFGALYGGLLLACRRRDDEPSWR